MPLTAAQSQTAGRAEQTGTAAAAIGLSQKERETLFGRNKVNRHSTTFRPALSAHCDAEIARLQANIAEQQTMVARLFAWQTEQSQRTIQLEQSRRNQCP